MPDAHFTISAFEGVAGETVVAAGQNVGGTEAETLLTTNDAAGLTFWRLQKNPIRFI